MILRYPSIDTVPEYRTQNTEAIVFVYISVPLSILIKSELVRFDLLDFGELFLFYLLSS